jgi:hypothetical protein
MNCTDLGPGCSVEDTIYGYEPNLGLNAFFLAVFALFALIHIPLFIRYKTWFYGIAIAMGCIGEAIGYGGRIIMHSNPVSSDLLPAHSIPALFFDCLMNTIAY